MWLYMALQEHISPAGTIIDNNNNEYRRLNL